MLVDGAIYADGSPKQLLRNDDLLSQCKLTIPYPLQFCRELKRRGVDIGEHVSEKEVEKALWEFHLSNCLTLTAMEGLG